MERRRCRWVNLKNPRYIRYHDEEWGRPHYDDGYLFELLVLESFQAGLSWECILNKRESFRTAFDGFDCRISGTSPGGSRWSTGTGSSGHRRPCPTQFPGT